jgi:hypothetical protein
MSIAGGQSETCPYCLLPREIIAVRFSLFKPCAALFVCPSGGSTSADVDGTNNIRDRSRHLKTHLLLRWKRSNIVPLARTGEAHDWPRT